MVKELKIESLKSVNELKINCRKLNLFTGTNSSGKSTTLQGLLLFIQNLDSYYGLNGPFVSIGDFREARNFNTKSEKGLERQWGTDTKLADSMKCSSGNIHYISCNRIGSQDV